jgi:hypothetical protein
LDRTYSNFVGALATVVELPFIAFQNPALVVKLEFFMTSPREAGIGEVFDTEAVIVVLLLISLDSLDASYFFFNSETLLKSLRRASPDNFMSTSGSGSSGLSYSCLTASSTFLEFMKIFILF